MIWLAVGWAIGFVFGALFFVKGSHQIMSESQANLDSLEAHVDILADEVVKLKIERDAAMDALFLEPDVEDSPAWEADSVPTALGVEGELTEHAAHAIAYGKKMRTCAKCSAVTTSSVAFEYEWNGDDVNVNLSEVCQSCEFRTDYRVGSVTWACMEAARAWEGTRTAAALMLSEIQNQVDLSDLDLDLDQD